MIYNLLKNFVFLLPSEFAHHIGMRVTQAIGHLHRLGFRRRSTGKYDRRLAIKTPFGELEHPIGLAAGFDKNAEALWGWQALGFSFVEVGTVTPQPQTGNARPRLFRFVRYRAIVNRMGFNNEGVKAVAENIRKARKQGLQIKIGGNIGKNASTPLEKAEEDYRAAAAQIAEVVDYLVINVSSPNTPGLRSLQGREMLSKIVESVKSVSGDKPIFVKVAPDLFENFIDDIILIAEKSHLAGVICGNTLFNHASSETLSAREIAKLPNGGLSGRPVLETNLRLAAAYKSKKPDLFVIGVGGIGDAAQAQKYRSAGCELIQVYTGFVYGGPRFVKNVLSGLRP